MVPFSRVDHGDAQRRVSGKQQDDLVPSDASDDSSYEESDGCQSSGVGCGVN